MNWIPLSVSMVWSSYGTARSRFEECDRDWPIGLVVELGEGELGGAIAPDIEVQLAFLGTDFGDVDVEVPNWVDLNFCLAGLSPVIFGSRLMPCAGGSDAGRARQVRDGGLHA